MASRGLARGLKLVECYTKQPYHSGRPAVVSVAKLLSLPPNDSKESKDVIIHGFVRSIRKLKTRSFAVISDGTSLQPLQAILTPAQAHSLSTGSAVSLTGRWTPSPNASVQSHELHVEDVNVLGTADAATFPLQKKYQTPEYLRTMPHMRSRTPFNALMLRFRSKSIAQLTKYFNKKDFVQTHPPIITSSDCEGAGEVFTVATGRESQNSRAPPNEENDDGNFFRSPKYLTVSSQLHLEALAQSVGNVWTLSPTFRAEKSDTARHLSEFYMLEAEVSFTDELEDIMILVENMLRNLTTTVYHQKVGQEIIYGKRGGGENEAEAKSTTLSEELERRWQGMMSSRWPRISYTDAINYLATHNQHFERQATWESGLQAEHERFIASTVGNGQPVFVTKYPQEMKPFYMHPSATPSRSGPTVDCFDLLVPEVCEIAGGSMREYRLPQLLGAMRTRGLVAQPLVEELGDYLPDEALGALKWYVDLRRWGSVPHGGFGLGFDRMLGYLAGVQNIREVVTFPRWVGRCDC